MACRSNKKWVLVGGYHKDDPNMLIAGAFGEANVVFSGYLINFFLLNYLKYFLQVIIKQLIIVNKNYYELLSF